MQKQVAASSLFRFMLLYVSLSLLAIVSLTGCGKEDTKTKPYKLAKNISLKEYYPFKADGHWSMVWENKRGDRWRGALTVIGLTDEEGIEVYLVVDTTLTQDKVDICRSAYMWDNDGLKHLYRVGSNGDSTSFNPARTVLPARVDGGKDYIYDYHYEIYSSAGENVFSGDVRQTYQLIDTGSIRSEYGKWKDVVVVESFRTDDYADGTSKTRRQAVWFARGVGPVKIVTGIPLDARELEGDATGWLVKAK